MEKVIIIYYIYINPKRDWKCIINGQLNDLNTMGLLNHDIFIHICCENNKYILECINLINKFNFSFTISSNNKNQYEYPGIKLMYDVAQNNPDRILFYMHSKGMVFTNYKNRRSECELLWLRYTVKDYEKVIRIFNEQKEINKIGLMAGKENYIYCNFFWIKTNYLKSLIPPVITDNRYYYEEYIGNGGKENDTYSLITDDTSYFYYDRIEHYKWNVIKPSDEFKQVHQFFNLKNYTFYYGTDEDKIDITENVIKKCLTDNKICIPSGDGNRAGLFGDPYPGTYKSIFIKKIFTETVYTEISFIYIDLINDIVYQVDEAPEYIFFPEQKLKILQSFLKINYGTFADEHPEQLMATKYLTGNEKVLEIGGNIGRNSLVISKLLKDSSNLLTLESDPESYNKLVENRNINHLNFYTENSALSARKLIQNGWNTIPSEEVLPDYFSVNTITWNELKIKYQIEFDTLIIDCEGAFYYILTDFPEIINGINLIIMENDYNDSSHKNYIDSVLKQNNFYVHYSEPGGWGYCHDFFYQVWKR